MIRRLFILAAAVQVVTLTRPLLGTVAYLRSRGTLADQRANVQAALGAGS